MYKLAIQQELFDVMLENDGAGLREIIENEREYLFDFLLRMTRQYDRALDTIEEVFVTVESQTPVAKSLSDLRFTIYYHARELNREIWNVDTQKLENQGLVNSLARSSTTPLAAESIRHFQEIDKFIGALAPRVRESLLLNLRHEFTTAETAAIMGISVDTVTENISRVLHGMGNLALPKNCTLEDAILLLEPHEMPENRTVYMTDLQEIIGGIKKSTPSRIEQVLRILATIGFLGLILYFYANWSRLVSEFAVWSSHELLAVFR